MSNGDWCLIESDPGVFTELISQLGVKNVQMEEVYSLDDLTMFSHVHGLIFLFNLNKRSAETQINPSSNKVNNNNNAIIPDNLFFAHQVINNACATQAILGVLMNAKEIQLGDELTQFQAFTRDLPADMKGLAITNSEKMRVVHNSFSRQEVFMSESRKATKDDDLFHFISFVPFNGHVYELDGLKQLPVDHGEIPGNHSNTNWLNVVKPVLEKRMESYASSGEIRFNLMAVVDDPREHYRQVLKGDSGLDQESREEIAIKLQVEEEKHARMAKENARRRHNFIPLIFKLLELMAEKGTLEV